MPKAPKSLKSANKAGPGPARHEPLAKDYETAALGDGRLRVTNKPKRAERTEQDETFVDAATSRKILQMAKEQQAEIERDERPRGFAGRDEYDEEEVVGELDDDEDYEDYDSARFSGDEDELEIDADDAALFERFLPGGAGRPMTLADKIAEKLREAEAGEARTAAPAEREAAFPPKVVEVYSKVGLLLSRYRSGKLPKAFKIIPSLRNWEDVVDLTQPEQWSPNACFEATKLFVSSLKAKQSQRFLSNVILDRFRDDIAENKTLNYHLYRSLKKSLYKPAAFFKGFLFPLCESGTCTLREAVIVGSVMAKVSIPSLHSSAALLRLADMEYSGTNSLFIRVLLDKKYALPYKVIDGVVFHFLRFRNMSLGERDRATGTTRLPVLWHQALLTFAQRYKNDITEDQRDALLQIVKLRHHPKISVEIRRELAQGVTRDSMVMEE
ncbi:Bystin-domain-containing protein [Dipodascopsis tothii]|uniref:Bystin-domain-containing protein n=1 Tax=Dipodascopsis tothii TaxID=44089 RepID=UPI0034CE9A68